MKLPNSIAIAGVITGVVGVIAAYIQIRPAPKQLRSLVCKIVVTDPGHKIISNADVNLRLPRQSKDQRTDSTGETVFTLESVDLPTEGLVVVQAARYRGFSKNITITRPDLVQEVILDPLPPEPATSPLEPYKVVFRSGQVLSGAGSNFSSWYQVAAEPPKPGYVIDPAMTNFRLEGDRSCGAWSECEATVNTDQAVVFRFRLQGHNEWGSGGQALSEGFLTVYYKPR